MRYLVLVSHGTLAPGIHSVLKMLMGDNPRVLSTSLEDGMGGDVYTENVRQLLAPLTAEDSVVLLGDIVGGSPLTQAMNVLQERGLLSTAVVYGGVSLPMALTALMGLDNEDTEAFKAELVQEARDGVREIPVATDDDEDEEDL